MRMVIQSNIAIHENFIHKTAVFTIHKNLFLATWYPLDSPYRYRSDMLPHGLHTTTQVHHTMKEIFVSCYTHSQPNYHHLTVSQPLY